MVADKQETYRSRFHSNAFLSIPYLTVGQYKFSQAMKPEKIKRWK